jgi:hypothetical protein
MSALVPIAVEGLKKREDVLRWTALFVSLNGAGTAGQDSLMDMTRCFVFLLRKHGNFVIGF